MISHFDESGDLWLPVQASTAYSLPNLKLSGFAISVPNHQVPNVSLAATEMNLSAYIRQLIAEGGKQDRPSDYTSAFLTPVSAKIEINAQ